MKNYETVLMDWDGCLVKTLDVWLEACKEVLLLHGHNLTDLQIGESFGSFPALLTDLGVEDGQKGMAHAASLTVDRLLGVELYPGTLDLLEHLENKQKSTALITSSDEEQISSLLQRHDLGKFFMMIITGERTERRKPHPDPLLLAMSEIGAIASSTIIVGDSEKDILAAKAAGIDSVLVFPPEHERFYDIKNLKLYEPTYVVSSLTEVKDIIF